MSRYGPSDADRKRRLARALVVAAYGPDDVSATDYLAHRRDDAPSSQAHPDPVGPGRHPDGSSGPP